MHWRSITRLFGILLVLYSITFLPSLLLALAIQDGHAGDFVASFLITAFAGLALWLPNLGQRAELSVREGFLVVTLFWAVLGVVGALPFMLGLGLDLTDGVFESMSGFTTTGATVLIGLDAMPRSILYHRAQIQWLGGMGIIVLAVAILPMMGVGGMQLYRAESSGVSKQDKMTPRIAETARLLWAIYFMLTATCTIAFWAAGMSLFDAICHAFTAVATGGFSTHDASMAHFDSALIEAIAIVFMLAGGVNFGVHYYAWRNLSLHPYLGDAEVRTYLQIFAGATVFVAISLIGTGTHPDLASSFRFAAFQAGSVLTSTGFTTENFALWPLHLPFVLLLLSFTGGCAGSTAGGIKVLRVLILGKLAVRQLLKLVHPRAVALVKVDDTLVSSEIMNSVLGFWALYIATSLLLVLGNLAAGLDLESSLGAVMATINLLGPGLGEVAVDFGGTNDIVKWLGTLGMLAGRLEIFTLLVLFLPAYWRN